jgi:hypothetical protein
VIGSRPLAETRSRPVVGTVSAAPGTDGERRVRVGDVVHVQDGQLDEWWRIVPSDEADALKC